MITSAFALTAAVLVHAQLVAPLPRLPLPRPSATALPASANPNIERAGVLRNGVLTLAIDVVESRWHPESTNEPDVPALAFMERGKTALIPGPMIRVTAGTEIHLQLRSRVDTALTIYGLRPGVGSGVDSVHLAAGATRELRYRLTTPGSYFYFGALGRSRFEDRLWKDSQLNAALIVDPPGGSPPDRVLLMSEWFHPYEDANRAFETVTTINGKAFPHTERLTLRQGDSTRLRVLNAMVLHHPMHLHGFYYRVSARGTWRADSAIANDLQPLINTDLMSPGSTLTLGFLPTTPGNWLFHCHFSFHMDETVTLVGSPRDSGAHAPHSVKHDGEHSMRGLVMGIHVTPSPQYTEYRATNPRDMRLLVQKKAATFIGETTAYGFALQSGNTAPAADSVVVPGPVLELVRNQPVRITVVNNLEEPTGIHWHGLEIESFPDGVAGWSGMNNRIMPPIAPRDSFVAEFTPPRNGTYPYHSHLNERHQILSGMYGAIVVTDQPRDTTRDHLVIAGGGGPAVYHKIESPYALVNGRRFTAPLRLRAGTTHRLRLVSIHPDWRIAFSLRNDTTVARWRAVAKDGADLPPAQATIRPANVVMGPGETADFEFEAGRPGVWQFEIRTVDPGWSIPLRVIVFDPAK